MPAPTLTAGEVRKAADELTRMRGSLTSWLRYRTLNDRVLAGTAPTKRPLAYAQRVVAVSRDPQVEQDLAAKLHALLAAVMPGQTLPNADLRSNPNGAAQLAQLAILGSGGYVASGPTATGSTGLLGPWMWPALIVAGVLLTVTTAIRSAADVAKDREEKACIMAGACTDYGFWLKAGGILAIAWVAWKEFGKGGRTDLG